MQEKTAVIATPFQKKCIILQGHFNVKVFEWVQMLFEKAFVPQKKDYLYTSGLTHPDQMPLFSLSPNAIRRIKRVLG